MKMILKNKKRHRLVKPSRLIFLIVLLASNTLAWFIYATKVDSNVSVHVRAWNVLFEAGEHEITNTVNVSVDSIYPGMTDYEYEIKAYNRSEVSATLTYQVLSARILDTEYITAEYRQMLGETAVATDLTSAQLEQKLLNDYPFTISINTSSGTISQGNGIETYTLTVVWPYESGHDDIDTLWGTSAYDYKEDYPNSPSIALLVKITITQNPTTGNQS